MNLYNAVEYTKLDLVTSYLSIHKEVPEHTYFLWFLDVTLEGFFYDMFL